MGYFDVSCSVSNLSIKEEERCAFIALKEPLTSNDPEKRAKRLENINYFLDCGEVYEPAFLPIFGRYNGSGGITDIEKDDNTRFLEKELGLAIEDIATLITDEYAPLHETFPQIKEFDNHDLVSKENLEKYGFSQTKENTYEHEKLGEVRLEEMLKGTYVAVAKGKDGVDRGIGEVWNMKSLQEKILHTFGYIISVPNDEQRIAKRYKFLRSLSGMFVQRDIYDTMMSGTLDGIPAGGSPMSAAASPTILKKLGFSQKKMDKEDYRCTFERGGTEINYSLINGKTVLAGKEISTLEELFKETDRIADLEAQCCVSYGDGEDSGFKAGRLDGESLKGMNLEAVSLRDKIEGIGTEEIPKKVARVIRMEVSMKLERELIFGRNWTWLVQRYLEPLLDFESPEIIEPLMDFKNFCLRMHTTNHLFTPMMHGPQHGDKASNELLLRKSMMVLNRQSEERGNTLLEIYFEEAKKDLAKTAEILNEVLNTYSEEYQPSITQMSKYEILAFKEDNSRIKDIVESYI